MRKLSTVALALVICAAALLMWIPSIWSGRVFQLASFALAALWLARIATGAEPARLGIPLLGPLGLAACAAIQVFTGSTVYAWKTEEVGLFWLGIAALYFAALQTFAEPTMRRRFTTIMVIFGALLAVVSAAQYFTAGPAIFWLFETDITRADGRAMGPFLNRNLFAGFMELLLPVALYRALLDKTAGPFYSVAAAVMFAAVIASGSRGGAAFATAEIILVPLLLWISKAIRGRTALATLALLAVAVSSAVFATGYQQLAERLAAADPNVTRGAYRTATLAIAEDHPLTGIGLGNWSVVYPRYAVLDTGRLATQAHNDWLQWAAEGGIPAFALMLLATLWIAPAAFSTVWGLGVVIVLLHSLVDFQTQHYAIAGLLFIFAAAMHNPERRRGRRRRSSSKTAAPDSGLE